MPLSHGRTTRAMPGPSVIPDRVLRAMHREAPNIYEGELIDVTASVAADLKRLAQCSGALAMYIANGHGGWEATIANTLAPGDKALVLCNGRFAAGWGMLAAGLGVEVEYMDFGTAAAVDPAALERRLRADDGSIKAVLTVQTDTASSANNDIPALGQAIRAAGHEALFQVDAIASFACEPFAMDDWGVDVLVTACQKGLMTPPGIAMTFASNKALAARRQRAQVSPYWDWLPRFEPQVYYQNFFGTAPTHHLFGLRVALDMIFEEGVEAMLARHRTLARAVWAAAEVWAEHGQVRPNIADRAHRSVAVTTLCTAPGDSGRLRAWCDSVADVTLGVGLDLDPNLPGSGDDVFRIGHMGHLNPPMLLGVLGTAEAGMTALGIAHGGGALRAAADVIAAAGAAEPVRQTAAE